MEEEKGRDLYDSKAAMSYKQIVDKNTDDGWHEVFQQIPKLTNENILDAGCGYGRITVRLRELTQGQVYGIDISEEQLKLTRQHEDLDKYGEIEYNKVDMTQDICMALGLKHGFFDVANSIWVLQHAHSRKVLFIMVRNICNSLKKGGVYVGITMKTSLTKEMIDSNKSDRYEVIRKNNEEPLSNGESIQSVLFDKDRKPVFETTDYFYTQDTYRQAFIEGGFSSVEFIDHKDGTIFKAVK